MFTISEVNAQKKREIDQKTADRKAALDDIKAKEVTIKSKEQPEFSKYHLFPVKELPVLPTSLANPIISRSDTEFARFIRALGNMDWITQGHTKYHHTGGKYPYCQQEMHATFEDHLAACYDEQYKEDFTRLDAFVRRYKDALNSIYVVPIYRGEAEGSTSC